MSHYDAIVIGTGYGGAVTAARLVEAGLDVCVLERGRRYLPGDFPELPSAEQVLPDTMRWRWSPPLGGRGLWETRDLGDVLTVHAAGYGGGSLICANVQIRAPEQVFAHGWPRGWSRNALDPYYDLVAHRIGLELAPDVIPDAQGRPQHLTKRAQLGKALTSLGRRAAWAKAPLAVRFDDSPSAPDGQGRCIACGACDTGCNVGAKKTLDQNYLAVVDAAARLSGVDGRQKVDVYTLSEVELVERCSADDEAPSYVVHYVDHLESGHASDDLVRRTVTAPDVFLCAGAVGSTEILLRSQRDGALPDLPLALGRAFSPNADALGMVFDTTHPQKPDVGPTISSVLTYHGPAAGREQQAGGEDDDVFILLQDGGYALPVAASFRAAFRSPLWGERNRFREGALPGVGRVGESPHDPPRPTPVDVGRRRDAALPPAFHHIFANGDLPPALSQLASGALHGLRERVDAWRQEEEAALIGAVMERIRDRAWTQLMRRHPPLRALMASAHQLQGWLRRQLDGLVMDLAADAEQITREIIDERLALNDPQRWLATLVRQLAGERSARLSGSPDPDQVRRERDHVAMLLTMGRDRRSGNLGLDVHGELAATLEIEAGAPVYTTQESLMRDVARTLGGELRVSPDWAWNGRPLTVHAQGGCAMSDDAASGVTDAEGRVHGSPGLFVFDAGAFPESIGVNPSHTIAAMAERNVERFLTRHARDGEWLVRRAQEKRAAIEWVQTFSDPATGRFGRAALDPLASRPDGASAAPVSPPLGIQFDERMVGFVGTSGLAHVGLAQHDVVPEESRLGERRGRTKAQMLNLSLRVSTGDLRRFLESERHVLDVEGSASLTARGRPERRFPVRGTLTLMMVDEAGDRRMRYELHDTTGALFAVGDKYVRRRRTVDPYGDTMTLYLTMRDPDDGERLDAVLRVPLEDFFEYELPSLTVTGTDDPAASTWALVDFATFFFGHLGEAYADGLRRVIAGVGRRQRLRAETWGLGRPGRPMTPERRKP